jgi:hypothetical protein
MPDFPTSTALTSAPPLDEVSPAGKDGRRAAELLQASKDNGVRRMYYLSLRALARLLESSNGDRAPAADHFFDPDELTELRRTIEATNATADLLGRSRVRERCRHLQEKLAGVSTKSELDTFEGFADVPLTGIEPLPPLEAIQYFQSLVPELAVAPEVFGPAMRRRAFTMAVRADQVMLERVKAVIADALERGQVSGGPQRIAAILEQAGVMPANPGYAENVFRTNMMESYNQGAVAEMQAPNVAPFFPAWQYLGIDDGRQRDRHDVHFNKLFPARVTFQQVRDSVLGRFDGFQCRCAPRPVDMIELAELEKQGITVETSW